MSVQWGDEPWPTADERWAEQALFTEQRMRFPGESGGDGSNGGRHGISARTWKRWAIAALIVYRVLALIVGGLIGLLP